MQQQIKINQRIIGPDQPPFIIAEMSGNHNQSLDRALDIVQKAADAGVDAIKLQTYTADTMTINISQGEFFIEDPDSLWQGKSLHKLYEEAYTPWEWHKPIFEKAAQLGITAFSSPFDASAVDFLQELGAPCYKIASFENTDLPLIRKVAATGKPVIISTGMATEEEIQDAVQAAQEAGCKDLILLKCTSAYPAKPEDANLNTINDMRQRFDVQIGLSDHTLGLAVPLASVALGATVIEKHFTLSRADGGVDSAFSLEPDELGELVSQSKRAWQSLGQVSYGTSQSESKNKVFRRSIYIVQDIKAGETFSCNNIRPIRPGLGLSPKYYDEVVGKKAASDLSRGKPLEKKDVVGG